MAVPSAYEARSTEACWGGFMCGVFVTGEYVVFSSAFIRTPPTSRFHHCGFGSRTAEVHVASLYVVFGSAFAL